MTFQYFFFDTYIGYFLQVIPITLIVGIIYGIYKFKKDKNSKLSTKIWSIICVCYLTGLISLTAVPMHLWSNIWYYIFYHNYSGASIRLFEFNYNFIPNFISTFSMERLGNILLYIPFGILYPLSKENNSFKNTVLTGVFISLTIEFIQPFISRGFDINDIIMNSIGVIVSSICFYGIKKLIKNN